MKTFPSVSPAMFATLTLTLALASCGPDLTTDAQLDEIPQVSLAGQQGNWGIVASVVPAPVTGDGNVAGAVTDIVINLDISMDPAMPGRSLAMGNTIKVTLPDAFENTGALPLEDLFSSPTCVPGNFQCNTAVLLQGWPQHPLLPRFPPTPPGTGAPQYSLTMQGTHTLVFTADVDVVPGLPAPGPGIKQAHLLLFGFLNPGPGFYDIEVEAETGPGGAMETGAARLQILPRPRPKISVTSAFNAGAPNTIYQSTAPGMATPVPYDFLLWAQDAVPMTGVTIAPVNSTSWQLEQGQRVVGHISLDGPSGASGQSLMASAPSAAIGAPVTGVPTARLTASFTAGSATGRYSLTFSLVGGNSIQMFVDVS